MDESGGGGAGGGGVRGVCGGGSHCQSLKTQEAGPWERLNAAFDVFPRIKMIEDSARVHEDVTQNEQNPRGWVGGGGQRATFSSSSSVLVLCVENYSYLSRNTTSLFSFNVAVQYGEGQIARDAKTNLFFFR